jgi:hypothetical protein
VFAVVSVLCRSAFNLRVWTLAVFQFPGVFQCFNVVGSTAVLFYLRLLHQPSIASLRSLFRV